LAKKRYTGPYVSRGGEKLKGALEALSLDVTGLRCLDVGASTGGFTDCLLQAGAESVVALDVAYGQFAWKLRQDPRVHVIERTNFKSIDLSQIDESFAAPYDLVVADLSFISLAKLSEQFKTTISPEGQLLLLVKPQFEAHREEVPAGGVITDPQLQAQTLRRLASSFRDAGIEVLDWTYSPIKGPKGNIEFWVHAGLPTSVENIHCPDYLSAVCATIESTVSQAHESLD